MSRRVRGGSVGFVVLVGALGCRAEARPTLASTVADAGTHVDGTGAETDGGAFVGDSGSRVRPSENRDGACALSADCAPGTHCDLGACASDCDAVHPCAEGTTCSARGRCLGPTELDDDPVPSTEKLGEIRVASKSALLEAGESTVRVHLVSTSASEVRYRLETDAPYLSPDPGTARGSFTGETTLAIPVDTGRVPANGAVAGVHVYTTLGNLAVTVPFKDGLSGKYRGALEYQGTDERDLPLGSSHLAFSLTDDHADLALSVDSASSLLFPKDGDREVTGFGTLTDHVSLSVRVVHPSDFGAERNPFRRPIGRDLHFELTPTDDGLEGDFTEAIFGLFARPVSLRGHAHFQRVECPPGEPGCDTPIAVADTPVLPTDPSATPLDFSAVFGWPEDGCKGDPLAVAAFGDFVWHQPFVDRLSRLGLSSAEPVADLAADCREDLLKDTISRKHTCASAAGIGCAVGLIAEAGLGSDARDPFATAYAHLLDAPVFVAEDDIVAAASESFLHGPSAEKEHLETARSVLSAPLAWAVAPAVLEYLRGLQVDAGASGVEPPAFVAARTLASAFHVRSAIDAEVARIAASERVDSEEARRKRAQEDGVLALVSAALLANVSESWTSAPPALTTEFVDVLTPMDRAFGRLAAGPAVLGVPEAYVPFVFEPGREPTNFEQVLKMTTLAVDAFATDETTFTTEHRDFEQSEDAFARELEGVRTQYDTLIASTCGQAFDVDKGDFSTCGADGAGTYAEKLLEMTQAAARLDSAQGRITAKAHDMDVETERIAAVRGVRDATIEFTKSTGDKLIANIWEEGAVNAAEKFVDLAAQADLLNLGVPVGEAAAGAMLEMSKAQLEVNRQSIETAEQVQIQQADEQVEVIDSVAAVRTMMVDLAQLVVEANEALIGVLQARLDADDALAEAKHSFAERAKALARIGTSSLNDPTARILASRAAVAAMDSREEAARALFLAGRALEYHVNQSFGGAIGKAALSAFSATEANRMKTCLQSIFDGSRFVLPTTQDYVVDVSLRRQLGVRGPRVDAVTGKTLSEGEQFRKILLANQNLDSHAGAAVSFSSNLDPENHLWSAAVCDDRITGVQAELVGDFLGDDEAEVHLRLEGGGTLRRCDQAESSEDSLMSWSTTGHAVIQAGVNTFGKAQPNTSLFGLPVASASFVVAIPGPSDSPSNVDVDLTRLEDVVLRVHHAARPIPETPASVTFDCLADVGATTSY